MFLATGIKGRPEYCVQAFKSLNWNSNTCDWGQPGIIKPTVCFLLSNLYDTVDTDRCGCLKFTFGTYQRIDWGLILWWQFTCGISVISDLLLGIISLLATQIYNRLHGGYHGLRSWFLATCIWLLAFVCWCLLRFYGCYEKTSSIYF